MKNWEIDESSNCEVTGNEYHINGKRYLRVTHTLGIIAKEGLAQWYLRIGKTRAQKIVKKRQILGTRVHKIFELLLNNKKVDLTEDEEEILTDVKMFKEFRKKCKLEMDATEQHVWSNKYSYAGTVDYIGMYVSNAKYIKRGHVAKFNKASRVIVDWKTASAIYDTQWLQVAAYVHAFYELTGLKLDGGVIAQFRNDRVKVEEKNYDELIELFNVYKAVITLNKWKHKNWETV